MRKILAVLIVLNVNWGFSQVNLDSLMVELTNPEKFIKLGYGEPFTSTESFLQFQRVDKQVRYKVYLDSTGKIAEYIGVSAIYERFDEKGRIIKRIGYHIDGSYYLWDYFPIEEWSYDKNTTVQTFYDYKNSFTDRRTETIDDKDRIIEIIEEGKDHSNFKKTIFQYNDSLHTLITSFYDHKGKLKPDVSGAAIIYQRKDSSDSLILEEKYYNSKHKLVDGNHIYTITSGRLGYLFSTVYYRTNEYGQFLAYFYNTKGELVCVADTGPPYSIIIYQIHYD